MVSGAFLLENSFDSYLISTKQQDAVAPPRKLQGVSRVAGLLKLLRKDTYLSTTS